MKHVALAVLAIGLMVAMPFAVQAQGWTNGYYHGPRDGQCWNNKRGC